MRVQFRPWLLTIFICLAIQGAIFALEGFRRVNMCRWQETYVWSKTVYVHPEDRQTFWTCLWDRE
jgi:hypothetical protein